MAEERKWPQEGFQGCCKGMPCGELMRQMMEAGKSGRPFNCGEMISKMMKIWGEAKKGSPPKTR